MKWSQVLWDPMPGGNVEHIDAHDLTMDEVEHVLENYTLTGVSHSSGRPCVFGYTPDGRYILVAYDEIDEDTIMPVTAYEVPEP